MRLTSTSDSSNTTAVQIDQRLVRSAHATAADSRGLHPLFLCEFDDMVKAGVNVRSHGEDRAE